MMMVDYGKGGTWSGYLSPGSITTTLVTTPPTKEVEESDDLYGGLASTEEDGTSYSIKDDFGNYLVDPHEVQEFLEKERQKIDRIEKLTLQVLMDIQSIADRQKRVSIDKVIGNGDEEESLKGTDESIEDIKERHLDRVRPFRRDIHIFEEGYEQPIQTNRVLSNAFSVIKNIFLGYESLNPKTQYSTDETFKLYGKSKGVWESELKDAYPSEFAQKIEDIFVKAQKLLYDKQTYTIQASYERYTLYALAGLLTCIKVGANRPHYTIMGWSVGVIFINLMITVTTLFMFAHYGRHSFQQSRLTTDLMRLAEETYTSSVPKRS